LGQTPADESHDSDVSPEAKAALLRIANKKQEYQEYTNETGFDAVKDATIKDAELQSGADTFKITAENPHDVGFTEAKIYYNADNDASRAVVKGAPEGTQRWTDEAVNGNLSASEYSYGHGKQFVDADTYGGEGLKSDVIGKSVTNNKTGITYEIGKDGDTGEKFIRTTDAEGNSTVEKLTKQDQKNFNKLYSRLQEAKYPSRR
jgi:hypothetical protein